MSLNLFGLFNKFRKKEILNPSHILVVEDNEADRKLIQRTLEKGGHSVFSAHNGEEGLRLVGEHKIDLIILDYLLPGANGIKVCEILKRDRRTKDIPIIFLTVVEGGGEILGFYEAGAEVYLKKPIDRKHLLKEVTQLLAESRPQ